MIELVIVDLIVDLKEWGGEAAPLFSLVVDSTG
jgi:hypothetical protein